MTSASTRPLPHTQRDINIEDSYGTPQTRFRHPQVFAGHLYGHLEASDRAAFLAEAGRVADELVILDSGRPPGARPEEWQTRSLSDGSTHRVYKRHFDVDALVAEVGGEALFGGRYFVLVRRSRNPTRRSVAMNS